MMAESSEDEPLSSPLKLTLPQKRQRLSTDWKKCLICQETTTEKVSYAGQRGIDSLTTASGVRQDGLAQRLETKLGTSPITQVVYHRSCYQSYTSQRNLSSVSYLPDCSESGVENVTQTVHTRAKSISLTDWSKCFICHSRKRVKLHCVQTITCQETVAKAAKVRGDMDMLGLLEGEDLFAKDAVYHGSCLAAYTSKRNMNTSMQPFDTANEHKQAFSALLNEIDTGLKDGKAYKMKNLLERYRSNLPANYDGQIYTTQKLKRQLLNHYRDDIVIHSQHGQSKSSIVLSSKVSLGDAVRAFANLKEDFNTGRMVTGTSETTHENDDNDSVLHHAVGIIRQDIAKMNATTEYPTSADMSLESSEHIVPPSLQTLFLWLISTEAFESADVHFRPAKKTWRKILALSECTIHCNRRQVITPLQLGLAVQLHHTYGKRDIIDNLSAHGFCIPYDDLRRFLTAVGNDELRRSKSDIYIPHGLIARPDDGSFIQEGDDNIDINCQMVDGKGTFHSMARVVFQDQAVGAISNNTVETIKVGTEKSMLLAQDDALVLKNILHYEKPKERPEPPRMDNALSKIKDLKIATEPIDVRELSWLLLRVTPRKTLLQPAELQLPEAPATPFWTGFNHMMAERKETKTVAVYAPIVDAKPSDPSVIYTTMLRSKEMMRKLGQEDTVQTMDQQLYAVAQQVKWSKPLEFGHTILRLGGFHTLCCFIGVIGKVWGDAGLKDLLVESGVYAEATVDMMLMGKQFHRSVRGLTLAYEALMQLLLEEFSKWCDAQEDRHISLHVWKQLEDTLAAVQEGSHQQVANSVQNLNLLVSSDVVPLLQEFREWGSTESPTFKFWLMFLDTIQIMLRNIRAEREGIWNLHLSTVLDMTPYMFATDRINYCRWVPIYLMDMTQLPADVSEAFQSGKFTVRRAAGCFNGIWSDMGVESTVIRDTKGDGGVIGLTRKESALLRWTLTRHFLGEYATALRERSGNNTKENVEHEQTHTAALKRDEEHVHQLVNQLESSMTHPFKPVDHPDGKLVNISSGVIANSAIQTSLSNILESGQKQMEDFIQDTLSTGGQRSLYKPIPKSKLKTFTDMKKQTKLYVAGRKKLVSVNPEIVFRRALQLTQVRPDLTMKDVLSYPITSVPTSIFHDDGAQRKNTKSDLAHILECLVQQPVDDSRHVDPNTRVYIRDAMAEIHKIAGHGGTFGGLAQLYMNQLLHCTNSYATVIDVFDQYDNENSVKAEERARRLAAAGDSRQYQVISGRPLPQWKKFMAQSSNKSALTNLICNHIVRQAPNSRELAANHDKNIYLAGGFLDGTLTASVSSTGTHYVDQLSSTQEEADTRIFLHVTHIDALFGVRGLQGNITIKSSDTDVLVLAVYYFKKLQHTKTLWIEKNTSAGRTMIPVHMICEALSQDIQELLPAMHALTGCDSVSALYGQGKKKVWKSLQSLQERNSVPHLEELGSDNIGSAIDTSRQLVSMIYDPQNKHGDTHDNLNALREKMATRSDTPLLRLPPSEPSFFQHVKRASYQTRIWMSAHIAKPDIPTPDGHGWFRENNTWQPKFFDGPTAAEMLADLICSCRGTHPCATVCSCRHNGLLCTEECMCASCRDDCENKPPEENDPDADSDDD